nr:hypothetical protein [Lachnospiraceae bacterium]
NFNQSNDDYRIRVVTLEYSDEIEDWDAYKLKWLRKGLFNKSFDLVAFDDKEALSKFSIRWFISPLDKFIKKDAEVDLSDCFENVLSVGMYKDKLYGVMTEYGINTLVMREKEADKIGLGSKQDMKNYISSIPNGAKTIYGFSRIGFLNFMLELNSDEFINGKKYNFDNQAFIDLLKEAKDYSAEDSYVSNRPDEEKEAFDSGQATIADCYMRTVSDYLYFSDFVFSEPIKCIGIPATSGGINELYEGPIVSISKKSAKKDGSWQFVKCFLTGKFDTQWDTPINKDSYYKHASEVEGGEIWDSNAEVHKINPPTQESIDAFYDLILSAKPKEENAIKKEVLDIIDEEALEFFKKKKTAEEAAKAIQEKVK